MATTNILDLNNRIDALENKHDAEGSADDVTYDNTDSGLTADDVQGAIDELAGDLSGLSADDVTYDNTDSGLTADTVQEAIDETISNINNLDAGDIAYDNTTSGMSATTVQGALDSLQEKFIIETYRLVYNTVNNLRLDNITIPAGCSLDKSIFLPLQYGSIQIKVVELMRISTTGIIAFGSGFTTEEYLDVKVLFFK